MLGKRLVFFIVLAVLLLVSLVAGVYFGSVDIPFMDTVRILLGQLPGLGGLKVDVPDTSETIIMKIRLPVVVMALFVGMGLASSGASMQGLFRNPLVDPFIIGISAGGAFGAILGSIITTGMLPTPARTITIILSFVFAVATVFLAYLISRRGNRISIANMLLAGIALSAFLTALTHLLTYFFIDNPKAFIFHLMGSCANSSWEEVAFVVPVVLAGTLILVFFGRDLNAFAAGEEGAKHLGVDVEKSKFVILCVGSLITAISIPFCGIIAFVGLIIPHIVRIFIGPDHRLLLPGSALAGGVFLVACDLFSRTGLTWATDIVPVLNKSQVTMPVGIVTALIGGLFFVYLLAVRRDRR
jgi:iron complex transport system permease protein